MATSCRRFFDTSSSHSRRSRYLKRNQPAIKSKAIKHRTHLIAMWMVRLVSLYSSPTSVYRSKDK